jgi:hypothetical protein
MNLTIGFVILTTVVVIVFDVWVILKKGKYESISAHFIRFYSANKMEFFVLIGVGLLMGHLLWSMNTFDYADKEYLIERCREVLK